MKASDMARIVLQCKGRMPESSRAFLAHKLLRQIGLDIQARDANLLKEWADSGGPAKFMDDCELDSGLPTVYHEIAVDDSELATFCNRWMNVEQYRDPDDGEWKPITPEMNQIRYTIVKELEQLWRSHEDDEDDVQHEEVQSADDAD